MYGLNPTSLARAALAVTLILAGAALSAPPPRISMTGFGQVRIGSTVAELEAALGRKIDPPEDGDESCRYAMPGDLYGSLSFMLIDGRLARIDVDEPGIPTVSGVSVGDSQASVIAHYGSRLEITAHALNLPGSKYLTLLSRDKAYGIRFETDGTEVTRYYAGTADALQYIEGCL